MHTAVLVQSTYQVACLGHLCSPAIWLPIHFLQADTLLPKEREERRDFVHKQLERARNLHIKKMERCNFLPNTVLEEAGQSPIH